VEDAPLADAAGQTPAQTPAQRDDVGPNSQSETERKLVRVEELERENCRLLRQVAVLEQELADLNGKLAAEKNVHYQRRLFRHALTTAREANTAAPKTLRPLREAVAQDLIELARSLDRDGISIDRLDVYCRAKLH
jgi:hypothetical protein